VLIARGGISSIVGPMHGNLFFSHPLCSRTMQICSIFCFSRRAQLFIYFRGSDNGHKFRSCLCNVQTAFVQTHTHTCEREPCVALKQPTLHRIVRIFQQQLRVKKGNLHFFSSNTHTHQPTPHCSRLCMHCAAAPAERERLFR
jgi:hypothetical protein